jgi:hypothetical protein
MKLEAGKYYRRRDGQKAFCYGEWFGEPGYWLVATSGHPPYAVTAVGTVRRNLCYHNGCDIISEWREPESITFYVWAVKCGDGIIRPSLNDSNCGVVGRKQITITEGEGMEPKE